MTTSSNSKNFRCEKRIEILFSKFAAFYGAIWRKPLEDISFSVFVKKEWQEALKIFSDDVLTTAIKECRRFHYEYPPTLPQMELCCRAIQKRNEVEVKKPFVPGNREVAMTHIKQCLAMLKK